MKLLLLLVIVAVLGKASAVPRRYYENRPVLYRMEEESEEDNQVQDDVAEDSEEDEPPSFSKLFPAAPSGQNRAPYPNVFTHLRNELQEKGWKPQPGKKNQQRNTYYRTRADNLDDATPRWRSFRMAEESEEDEEDDIEEPEDDDPFPPAMNKMFPGLPSGSSTPEGEPKVGPASQSRPYSGRPQGGPQGGPPQGGPQGGPQGDYQGGPPVGFQGGPHRRYQSAPQPQSRYQGGPPEGRFYGGPQGGPGPRPGARRGPRPPTSGERQYRATVVGNRYPVSYAQQPLVNYGRPPMSYRYAPRQNMPQVVGYRMPIYAHVPQRRVYSPSQYRQQSMPMYGRRQMYQQYQVPVQMSVPARRYSSPALSSQKVYNGNRRPVYYPMRYRSQYYK